MKARLTGKVLLVENVKFGSGEREFRFKECSVQTGVASIEKVRVTDSWLADIPRVGDFLDVEVEIGAFAGRSGVTISATAVKTFDLSYALELAAA